MTATRKLGRTCSACPTIISDQNKSGMCKSCGMTASNRDPRLRRKRGATISKMCGPLGQLRKQRLAALDKARAMRDFEAAKARGIHAAAMVRFNRRHLKWLPDHWRPTYEKMLRSGDFRAPEAKRIILEQLAAERRRMVDRLGADEKDTARFFANAAGGSRALLDAMREMAR